MALHTCVPHTRVYLTWSVLNQAVVSPLVTLPPSEGRGLETGVS